MNGTYFEVKKKAFKSHYGGCIGAEGPFRKNSVSGQMCLKQGLDLLAAPGTLHLP